jgi:hypothetical protein
VEFSICALLVEPSVFLPPAHCLSGVPAVKIYQVDYVYISENSKSMWNPEMCIPVE